MPELRKDPIISRWVIISTERAKRPADLTIKPGRPRGGFCPLCPGNEDKTPPEVFAFRDEGSLPNTPGWRLRVVPNKFPALVTEGETEIRKHGIYESMDGLGTHEVILETDNHDANELTLSNNDYKKILLSFKQRINDLKNDKRFRYIAIFKNKGEMAGSSLEHPNSQIIALPVVPKRSMEELEGAEQFYKQNDRCVYCEIIKQELQDQQRIVYENDLFLAFEPYAPRFPFETVVLPKQHIASFELTDHDHFDAMADVFSTVMRRINKALNFPPYNFMLHNSPVFDDAGQIYYHWHFEIIPRLTKLTGFEWGSGFYINPIPPEHAAQYLRDIVSD